MTSNERPPAYILQGAGARCIYGEPRYRRWGGFDLSHPQNDYCTDISIDRRTFNQGPTSPKHWNRDATGDRFVNSGLGTGLGLQLEENSKSVKADSRGPCGSNVLFDSLATWTGALSVGRGNVYLGPILPMKCRPHRGDPRGATPAQRPCNDL